MGGHLIGLHVFMGLTEVKLYGTCLTSTSSRLGVNNYGVIMDKVIMYQGGQRQYGTVDSTRISYGLCLPYLPCVFRAGRKLMRSKVRDLDGIHTILQKSSGDVAKSPLRSIIFTPVCIGGITLDMPRGDR